jgi:hypothetical protein
MARELAASYFHFETMHASDISLRPVYYLDSFEALRATAPCIAKICYLSGKAFARLWGHSYNFYSIKPFLKLFTQ